MRELKHISASQLEKFIACPAWWGISYDDDAKFNSRTDWTDAGTLVHAALERWRNPQAPRAQTFDELERCFREVCTELQLAETLAVFKRGLDLIRKAFEIDMTNRHLPMNLAITLAVEQEIVGYQPEGWAVPFIGFIDRISMIRIPTREHHIILVIEDYKTGRVKSWSELTEEEPQPAGYMAWGQDILRSWIASQIDPLTGQPYEIEKIVLLWSYIDHGIGVPIYESDIEIDEFKAYVGSISHQMVAFKKKYNEFADEINERVRAADAVGPDGADVAEITALQEEFNNWLAGFERVNSKCSWCPRKRVCRNFNRQMQQDIVKDMAIVDLNEFLTKRQEYASIAKAAEEARKGMDAQFRAYLDKNNLTEVCVGGRIWTANTRADNSHSTSVVAELLGVPFVLNAAKLSQTAVDKEVARIATFDPERAKQLKEQLDQRMLHGVGARVVDSKQDRASASKRKKEKPA